MARTRVRLPLPIKKGSLIPSRGKERREPLVGSDLDPQFCPDCEAQLTPEGKCPNWMSNDNLDDEIWYLL